MNEASVTHSGKLNCKCSLKIGNNLEYVLFELVIAILYIYSQTKTGPNFSVESCFLTYYITLNFYKHQLITHIVTKNAAPAV